MMVSYMIIDYEDDGINVYKCFHCRQKWAAREGKWNFCPHCGSQIELKQPEMSKRKKRIAGTWIKNSRNRGWSDSLENNLCDCLGWNIQTKGFGQNGIHSVSIWGMDPYLSGLGHDLQNYWELMRTFSYNGIIRTNGWYKTIKENLSKYKNNGYGKHEGWKFKLEIDYLK